jgi:hypothetical protein
MTGALVTVVGGRVELAVTLNRWQGSSALQLTTMAASWSAVMIVRGLLALAAVTSCGWSVPVPSTDPCATIMRVAAVYQGRTHVSGPACDSSKPRRNDDARESSTYCDIDILAAFITCQQRALEDNVGGGSIAFEAGATDVKLSVKSWLLTTYGMP